MSGSVPKSGEFAEGMLWFERTGEMLTLGLTNAAIEEIGSVEGLELPEEGDDFDKGEVVVSVSGSNGNVDVICPAAGIIKEINGAAQEEPTVVGDDPLEEGWLVKLEIQDATDLKEFLSN